MTKRWAKQNMGMSQILCSIPDVLVPLASTPNTNQIFLSFFFSFFLSFHLHLFSLNIWQLLKLLSVRDDAVKKKKKWDKKKRQRNRHAQKRNIRSWWQSGKDPHAPQSAETATGCNNKRKQQRQLIKNKERTFCCCCWRQFATKEGIWRQENEMQNLDEAMSC